jgi:tellurite methyltransferase
MKYLKINIYFVILNIIFQNSVFSKSTITPDRYEILSGKRADQGSTQTWDKLYSKETYVYGKKPAKFLAENYQYLPENAKVLDMGMGEGRNAVFLALKGHNVTGVDQSVIGVKKARMLAREFGVRFNAVVSKMEEFVAGPGSFDAIICFYFVDRSLNEKINKWLKPNGILIYEAHTKKQKSLPGNENYEDQFLLGEGELLKIFPGFKVLKFEEPLHKDEFTSSIILQKVGN